MKRVASFSVVSLILSTLFLFTVPIPHASAAACVTPTQTTFTETGTTYIVQTFTTSATNCTWLIPANISSLRIAIVGGGGGAGFGACGGGGGAGRVIVSNSAIAVTANASLTLTVGNGGQGGWRTGADWRAGLNGESSSATVSGNTYLASGGGGGAGSGTALGFNGGSGGGGTGCNSASGGAPDSSPVTGFASYATIGATGTQSGPGGGGGGASTAGNSGNGGDGFTLWGATFAGGGGGWSGGSGGSGGGGSSLGGTTSKALSGNPGASGTGSGGGGGNDGGSGRIMIRYLVEASLGAPSVSGLVFKGVSIVVTVTSTVPGRVRFSISGKRVPQCLANVTLGTAPNYSATCSWTPPTRGYMTLTALFTPTDPNYSVVNAPENKIFVLNRTTKR